MSALTRANSSSGNLAEEFPTRIMECGLLPLSCAGVEVSNKLHVTCTVVKGARPRRPVHACSQRRFYRGVAVISFSSVRPDPNLRLTFPIHRFRS